MKACRSDPLVHCRISAGQAGWMLTQGAQTLEDAGQWQVPTLLLCAGQGRLVNAQASADFARSAPKGVVQAQCFEGDDHEIFNDLFRAQVFTALKR